MLNNLYGVDLDEQAVEVTKLSLLLKCLEGETTASMQQSLGLERVLPTIDQNIRVGNSLVDIDFYDGELDFAPGTERAVKPFSWRDEFAEVFQQGGFDAVIGNPPYGYMISPEQQTYFSAKYRHQDYQKDLYLLFLERAKLFMRADGWLGWIIPNTWLQSINLRKIRTYLLQEYTWDRVLLLPERVFEDAIVDTHVILMKNSKPSKKTTYPIEVETMRNREVQPTHHIAQSSLNSNGDVINVATNPTLVALAQRVINAHPRLDTVCAVYNGVKPFETGKGKPPQTKEIMASKPYVQEGPRPAGSDWMPLLRGSLIERYGNRWDHNSWIKYGPWLAAPRDRSIFTQEEVVFIRQTSDKLIGVLTPGEFIARNNLHVINKKDKNYSLYFILGLINSSVLDAIYTVINPEKGEALAEVKKHHLEQLPIPTLDLTNPADQQHHDTVVSFVGQLLALHPQLRAATGATAQSQLQARIRRLDQRLDHLVYLLYGLSYAEAQVVEPGLAQRLSEAEYAVWPQA